MIESQQPTLTQVIAIVADVLDQPTAVFTADTVLSRDHAPDSHDAMLIVLGVEETFSVDIANEELALLLDKDLAAWAAAIDERRG